MRRTGYGCARARPTARPQRMEVLRRPAAGGPAPGLAVVAGGPLPRAPAGAVRRRDGRSRRRGRARRRSGGPPCSCRGRLRAVAVARPPAPGARRESGRPDGGLAVRPAHGGVQPSTGPRAPRRPDADRRPDRGSRLRSGRDRAAALHLDGLHRRRPRRPDRRSGVRSPARRVRLVGTPGAGRRVAGWPRIGCCARAPYGATARPTRCAGRSERPTTPTGWRSIRRPARSCGCSVSRAGRSPASSPAGPGSTSCSTPRRGSASGPCC